MNYSNFKEIGSEFWDYKKYVDKEYSLPWVNSGKKHLELLSGRTALDLIIRDIKATRPLRSVYLPSYCCESMIKPFSENDIALFFYDVFLNSDDEFESDIDLSQPVDAIVNLDYFGFCNKYTDRLLESYSKHKVIIINDATQSFLSEHALNFAADYNFASLRKWYATPDGALLLKTEGDFTVKPDEKTNNNYLNTRLAAFELKKNYLEQGRGQKKYYLNEYHKAADILDKSYVNFKMSSDGINRLNNVDFIHIIKNRKANAHYLIENLKEMDEIALPFKEINDGVVPLFVPVIVKNNCRNKLKKYLIEHNIYCPVHWPLSDFHKINVKAKNIYNEEISLLCDQRYNTEDMKNIVHVIKRFYSKK